MRKRRGFTLIEMLVVMTISAIIIALLTRGVGAGLGWMSMGLEARTIRAELMSGMDFIEEDVRLAKDIDVDAYSGNLENITSTISLRLVVADEKDKRREGVVTYSCALPTSGATADTPPGRPKPNLTLYHAQKDSTHSGAKTAVASNLGTGVDMPYGLKIYYNDKDGTPCTLAEDIYSVRVVLSGQTRDGELVQVERTMPLGKQ